MGGNLVDYVNRTLSGGINTRLNGRLIHDAEATELRNVDISVPGLRTKRKGAFTVADVLNGLVFNPPTEGEGGTSGGTNVTGDMKPIVKSMRGEAQPNVVFGKHTVNATQYITRVELEAFAGAPEGEALVCRLKINGTVNAQSFALPAGAHYANLPLSAAITVPSGAILEWYFESVGTTAPGTEPSVTTWFQS